MREIHHHALRFLGRSSRAPLRPRPFAGRLPPASHGRTSKSPEGEDWTPHPRGLREHSKALEFQVNPCGFDRHFQLLEPILSTADTLAKKVQRSDQVIAPELRFRAPPRFRRDPTPAALLIPQYPDPEVPSIPQTGTQPSDPFIGEPGHPIHR